MLRPLLLALPLVLAASQSQAVEITGRYVLEKVEQGFLRLDSVTGVMSLCSAPELTCARAYAVPTSKPARDPSGTATNTGIASSDTVTSAGASIRYCVHCGARRYSVSRIDCAAAVGAKADTASEATATRPSQRTTGIISASAP